MRNSLLITHYSLLITHDVPCLLQKRCRCWIALCLIQPTSAICAACEKYRL
ncbi:hypothetical protein FDUTEX481_08054 [Tolypothrix sp. PCC 7601]|nr:hypothetical protein FDUTEX481_08054 [Tolypothrix sp. PCC 7601]